MRFRENDDFQGLHGQARSVVEAVGEIVAHASAMLGPSLGPYPWQGLGRALRKSMKSPHRG